MVPLNAIPLKNGSKYLLFASSDKNKEILENTQNFGLGLKN